MICRSNLISRGPALKLTEVRLLAPILTPRRNVFCVGKNYKEHAKEFNQSGFDASATEIPEVPIIFTKSTGSVIGPLADISSHSELTQSLDYEAELGVVIGRAGRAISREAALSHVWGYHHHQRRNRARSSATPSAMVYREVARHLLSDGALDCHRR